MRDDSRIWTAGAIVAVVASASAAQTPLQEIRYSADVASSFSGVLLGTHEVGIDDLVGTVTAGDLGLAVGVGVDAYHLLPSGDVLFSVDVPTAVGGVTALPGDVLRRSGGSTTVELSAGAVGVPPGASLDALSADGAALLLSFDVAVALPGLTARDEDVVRYAGGVFSLEIDGSLAGVTAGLGLDALHGLANGHWLVSLGSGGAVGGLVADDADVLEYDPLGGSWAIAYVATIAQPAWLGANLVALAGTAALPNPGQIRFTSTSFSAAEAGGTTMLTAERLLGNVGAVGALYQTSDLTATAGNDYTTSAGALTWADGEIGIKALSVTILDDAVPEGDEKVLVSLTAPSGGAQLGAPSEAELRILDDDTPPAGAIRFSRLLYSVGEAAGTATIVVERSGGSSGMVSVQYTTADGTALLGSDYLPAAGGLVWPDGDLSDRSFVVAIVDDPVPEGSELASLELFLPTGGAILPEPVSMLEIDDDDSVLEIPTLSDATAVLLALLLSAAALAVLRRGGPN